MKLNAPVDNFVPKLYPAGDVTQWFGENKALYSKAVCYQNVGCLQGHNGIDIVGPHGSPIYCVSGGVVVEVKLDAGGFGKHVRVLDNDSEWVYGHLSQINVTVGQNIASGEVLGLMGNSGFVVSGATPYWKYNPYAGTHLHLGRRKFTPYSGSGSWSISYATGDKGTIENYMNGFFGAVPITAEDFEDVPPKTTQTLEMTLQSLENNALEAEKQGKTTQANIIRAIKGIVIAFWG